MEARSTGLPKGKYLGSSHRGSRQTFQKTTIKVKDQPPLQQAAPRAAPPHKILQSGSDVVNLQVFLCFSVMKAYTKGVLHFAEDQLCCAVKCSFINGRFSTGLLALCFLYLTHVVSCLEKRTRIRTCRQTWPTPKLHVSVRHKEVNMAELI